MAKADGVRIMLKLAAAMSCSSKSLHMNAVTVKRGGWTSLTVLAKLCSQVQCAPAPDQSIEQSGNQLGQAHRPANGQSDSESDEEGYRVLTDGMDRTIPHSRAPVV